MMIMALKLQISFFPMMYTYLKAKEKARKGEEGKDSADGLKSWRTFTK